MKSTLIFPNITAALDLSAMDDKIIAYSRFMAKNSAAKTLRFLHVIPHFIFPEPVSTSFDEIVRGEVPIEQRIRHKLAKEIQPVMDDIKGLDIRVEVLQGSPQERLLMDAQQNKPDLLIVGKKTLSGNSGIIARRIARKTECSVCFVTHKATVEVKRLLVPVDFSETSARALHAAVQLQSQLGKAHITALQVIDLPATAYNINKNFGGLSEYLKKDAEQAFRSFLETHALHRADVRLKLLLNEHFNIAKHIMEVAKHQQTDLIITGARGHSRFEDIIFGSVTEKLVTYEEQVPVLVVR